MTELRSLRHESVPCSPSCCAGTKLTKVIFWVSHKVSVIQEIIQLHGRGEIIIIKNPNMILGSGFNIPGSCQLPKFV